MYSVDDVTTLERACALRQTGLNLAEMKLVCRILATENHAVDVDGLRQLGALLVRMRRCLDVTEQIVGALLEGALRRSRTGSLPAHTSARVIALRV